MPLQTLDWRDRIPQHHGSHRPTLARISDQLTKNGVQVITHQNADRASSTRRNNWLSLVWLRPRCFECKPGHTPFRQPWPEYSIDCSNSTHHRTLKPMPQKIQHPCRYTAQNSNSNFFLNLSLTLFKTVAATFFVPCHLFCSR